MPDITIIKLKIRRGTDAQRRQVVLEQGELGYAVDTGRVFIGDGVTKGGNTISPVLHLPVNTQGLRTITRGTQGDMINEAGMLYQLTGTDYTKLSSWTFIGTEVDNSTMEYTTLGQKSVLKLKDGSINRTKFASDAAYARGGLVATSTNGLSANIDRSTIIIDSNNQLKVNTINQSNISLGSFYNGIAGGSGARIGLNLKPLGGLEIDSDGRLVITSIPTGAAVIQANNISFDATFDRSKGITQATGGLIHARFYDTSVPITFDSNTGKLGLDYNTNQLTIANNKLELVEGTVPTTYAITQKDGYLQSVTVNNRGRVIGTISTIVDILSARSTTPELSAFNGYAHNVVSLVNGITAVDSDKNQVSLSSAGFLTLSGVMTQLGETIPGRIAIPIYLY